MTKQEAATILAVLKAAYPNSYKRMTSEEAMGTVSVWALQFADMPADIVLMAVHKAISTSPFPPAISEVKEKLSTLHWEAYSLMDKRTGMDAVPEEERKLAEQIYRETYKYRYSKYLEPSLDEMLHTGQIHLSSGSNTAISEGGTDYDSE